MCLLVIILISDHRLTRFTSVKKKLTALLHFVQHLPPLGIQFQCTPDQHHDDHDGAADDNIMTVGKQLGNTSNVHSDAMMVILMMKNIYVTVTS